MNADLYNFHTRAQHLSPLSQLKALQTKEITTPSHRNFAILGIPVTVDGPLIDVGFNMPPKSAAENIVIVPVLSRSQHHLADLCLPPRLGPSGSGDEFLLEVPAHVVYNEKSIPCSSSSSELYTPVTRTGKDEFPTPALG